jgi:hypothetical protein
MFAMIQSQLSPLAIHIFQENKKIMLCDTVLVVIVKSIVQCEFKIFMEKCKNTHI